MVSDKQQHYRWDFIGLSSDTKPTPATSENVVDGSTFYCSDTSKLYVFYKGTWYENTGTGGGGGGGDFNVRVIDASDPTQWYRDRMTDAVIEDITNNSYTALHLINLDVDGITVDGWMFAVNNADVEDENMALRQFFHFDEGDEDEGTPPNIETWTCTKYPDGDGGFEYEITTEQYEFGEMNDVTSYTAYFDLSQGEPTLTQEDMEYIYTNKPNVIQLIAGTTTTIGNKSRQDTDTAQVIYSTIVMEGTTPTVYIITITYDEPNSRYVFDMNDYQLSASA